MTILVTGGAGFIEANFEPDYLATFCESVVSMDKLTFAGCRETWPQDVAPKYSAQDQSGKGQGHTEVFA